MLIKTYFLNWLILVFIRKYSYTIQTGAYMNGKHIQLLQFKTQNNIVSNGNKRRVAKFHVNSSSYQSYQVLKVLK